MMIGNGKEDSYSRYHPQKDPALWESMPAYYYGQAWQITIERILGLVLYNGQEIDKPIRLRDGDR